MSVLVLASGSPRRAALLRDAGIEIEVAPVACDETPHAGEDPVAYARRIAAAKLASALPRHEGRAVLVADTVVWMEGGEPLGKASSPELARRMIGLLTRGDPHLVTTAWALALPGAAPRHETETTRVWMRRVSAPELSHYLAGGHWRDKAGAYGIQDKAASFVTRIEGSYTNVVGLPLAQVVGALQEAGW